MPCAVARASQARRRKVATRSWSCRAEPGPGNRSSHRRPSPRSSMRRASYPRNLRFPVGLARLRSGCRTPEECPLPPRHQVRRHRGQGRVRSQHHPAPLPATVNHACQSEYHGYTMGTLHPAASSPGRRIGFRMTFNEVPGAIRTPGYGPPGPRTGTMAGCCFRECACGTCPADA